MPAGLVAAAASVAALSVAPLRVDAPDVSSIAVPPTTAPNRPTSPTGSTRHDSLVVRGAREHNLKDISVELPRDALICFTGLSGVGQVVPRLRHDLRRGPAPLRRVAVVLRPAVPRADGQARRRLHRGPVAGGVDRPEVDQPQPPLDRRHDHRGLRLPAAALRPRRPPALPGLRRGRSPASRPQQIVDQLLELPDRTRFQVLAPVVQGRKGEFVDLFAELQTKGFSRARVDGEVVSLVEPPKLDKKFKHTIEVVVDRLVAKGGDSGSKRRLTDSVETALRLAGGVAAHRVRRRRRPPTRRPCASAASPRRWPAPTTTPSPSTRSSRGRSPSTPRSAPAPTCTGIGTELEVDPELVVPDDDLSLDEGAIAPVVAGVRVGGVLPAGHGRARRGPQVLDGRAVEGAARPGQGGDPARRELPGPREVPQPLRPRPVLHHGVRGGRALRQAPARRDRLRLEPRALRGLHARGALPQLPGRPAQAGDPRRARRAARTSPRSARSPSTRPPTSSATSTSPSRERQIAERVIKEIEARLGFLLDVGLDYLSLDRPAGTLSGGEAQRIRLATQIGSGPRRRALRARRAVDRAAPARQPPAHRDADPAARPRQHPHRRRARRGHHRHRRLGRRHRSGRGGARRPGRPLGHRPGPAGAPRLDHRAVPQGRREITMPAVRRPRDRARGHRRRRPREQPARRHRRRSRSAPSSPSPASRARASRRSSTTSSTTCSPTSSTAPGTCPAGTRRSPGSSTSTRWCTSTRARSGGPRGPTRPPTPASSTTCASCSPTRPRPRSAATCRAGSRSTSRVVAATTAPATAPSRSR